jgi:large subunit ribosomal protein L4
MNKKEKRIALKSVLTEAVSENRFKVLDELKLDEIKTKKMAEVLKNLGVSKALIVVGEDSENVVLSARNIAGVQTASPDSINVYDILKYGTVIATKSSVEKIEEVYA